MVYKISNLTYQSIRVMINENEVIIPGRNDTLENSIVVDNLTDALKTLSSRGLIKIKIIS
jgi:hypothetical protein